jgi:hypothetical protein
MLVEGGEILKGVYLVELAGVDELATRAVFQLHQMLSPTGR